MPPNRSNASKPIEPQELIGLDWCPGAGGVVYIRPVSAEPTDIDTFEHNVPPGFRQSMDWAWRTPSPTSVIEEGGQQPQNPFVTTDAIGYALVKAYVTRVFVNADRSQEGAAKDKKSGDGQKDNCSEVDWVGALGLDADKNFVVNVKWTGWSYESNSWEPLKVFEEYAQALWEEHGQPEEQLQAK